MKKANLIKLTVFAAVTAMLLSTSVACAEESATQNAQSKTENKATATPPGNNEKAAETENNKSDSKNTEAKDDSKKEDTGKGNDKGSADEKGDYDKEKDEELKKDNSKTDDTGNTDNSGNHAETRDGYYVLLNNYDDKTLYGYYEDGTFVFWPGLWVSFGDGYVQYNWMFINQNAYSSRPGDEPSGTTRITVYDPGIGQDDWGEVYVEYSDSVVKMRYPEATDSHIFVRADLIDFNGDICAQLKAITGRDFVLPEGE